MDKNRNTIPQKETEDMLKEKTNQDFNNQKPNPEDPNQNKSHQGHVIHRRRNTMHKRKVRKHFFR